MSTLEKIRKTDKKNKMIISADVLYSETFDGMIIVHSRTNIITEFDPRTGEEGAKKAIMASFEKWIKGG